MKTSEIQDKEPLIQVAIGKVGVTGVKMPIGFAYFEKKPTIVVPRFSIYIDLPASQKGIHASRNYEIITETMEQFAGKTYKLEKICAAISKELLKRHEYASRSEVKAVGEAMIEKHTPKTDMITYEPCTVMAYATAQLKPDGSSYVKRRIGVGVRGITACPCAQELIKEEVLKEINLKHDSGELTRILEKIPWGTHMQRSYGTLITDVPDGFDVEVPQLINVVEKSMSSTSYELLKRADEAELVKKALANPKFVEDCVRLMMKYFAETFPELPDYVAVNFKQRSKETIHKHDFVAERSATLGEIRKELKNNNRK